MEEDDDDDDDDYILFTDQFSKFILAVFLMLGRSLFYLSSKISDLITFAFALTTYLLL